MCVFAFLFSACIHALFLLTFFISIILQIAFVCFVLDCLASIFNFEKLIMFMWRNWNENRLDNNLLFQKKHTHTHTKQKQDKGDNNNTTTTRNKHRAINSGILFGFMFRCHNFCFPFSHSVSLPLVFTMCNNEILLSHSPQFIPVPTSHLHLSFSRSPLSCRLHIYNFSFLQLGSNLFHSFYFPLNRSVLSVTLIAFALSSYTLQPLRSAPPKVVHYFLFFFVYQKTIYKCVHFS